MAPKIQLSQDNRTILDLMDMDTYLTDILRGLRDSGLSTDSIINLKLTAKRMRRILTGELDEEIPLLTEAILQGLADAKAMDEYKEEMEASRRAEEDEKLSADIACYLRGNYDNESVLCKRVHKALLKALICICSWLWMILTCGIGRKETQKLHAWKVSITCALAGIFCTLVVYLKSLFSGEDVKAHVQFTWMVVGVLFIFVSLFAGVEEDLWRSCPDPMQIINKSKKVVKDM